MRFYQKIKTHADIGITHIRFCVALLFYHSVKQKTIAFSVGTQKNEGERFVLIKH